MSPGETRILAIETSSRIGAAAIGTAQGLVEAIRLGGDMLHAREMVAAVADLLQRHAWAPESIAEVFVSVGPGSFTGLRIGVSMARTLGWSIGARLIAVPTLDALARNALQPRGTVPVFENARLRSRFPKRGQSPPAHVAVLLDAKRGQVYAAAYSFKSSTAGSEVGGSVETGTALAGGTYQKVLGPCLEEPLAFLRRCPQPISVLGEGIRYHRAAVAQSGATQLDEGLWPARAESVFAVGLELARAGQFTAAPGDLLPLYVRRPEAEEKWEKLHGKA